MTGRNSRSVRGWSCIVDRNGRVFPPNFLILIAQAFFFLQLCSLIVKNVVGLALARFRQNGQIVWRNSVLLLILTVFEASNIEKKRL